MAQLKESDWKKFKKIKEAALQKYCQEANAEFMTILSESDITHHQKYLKLYKTVDEKDDTIGRLFNGLSRSKAHMQLLFIRREGLADASLVRELSEEFQQQTDPEGLWQ